ncbi:MAG: DUF1501 domain-containing protein [Thiotrichaceae bacterium]
MNTINKRRDFLKSLLSTGIAGSLGPSLGVSLAAAGQLALMRQATAASPPFSDYKAIVNIFLYGGNDSFNMLIPTGSASNTGHGDYDAIRGNLAVANNDLGITTASSTGTDLNNGNLGTGSGNPYHEDGTEQSAYLKGLYDLSSSKGIDLGVNGVMPELAQLITDNKASVVANVGNLVNPVSRAEVLNDSANLPLFLFAHNHQQRALKTGQADNLSAAGWAGRIADNWQGINNNSPLGLNIAYSGSDRMVVGDSTSPLVLNPGQPPNFTGMKLAGNSSDQDRRAFFQALAGIQNSSSSGNLNFDISNTFATSDPFKSLYSKLLTKSQGTFDLLGNAWNDNVISYTSTGSYGEPLFSKPSADDLGFNNAVGGGLIKQLDTVAKMIDLGARDAFSTGSYNRQIFTVRLGGFDTHATQEDKHPLLLREISLALWKFQKAMEELGHANKVTTFTLSDFGRTVSNNGDGTDHAWGAHHIVMGGDGAGDAGNFKGGQMLGSLPDITLGGADDYSSKGRIIPTTSQDQLNATLCNWFGVDEALMPTVFPNLQNFKSGSDLQSAYLNDLFA